MTSYDRWLQVAVEAGMEAARFLREQWNQTQEIRPKGFRDIVTATDVAVESLILGRLREAFPTHALISEEAGRERSGGEVVWLIDPLDGTYNFAHHNPSFAVSIAAVENDVPVVGVVVDPLREHLFAAQRGAGATLNGALLRTTKLAVLEDVMLGFDTPRDPEARRRMWLKMGALLEQVRTVRATGSAALNMAYVAAGWFDLYTGFSIEPWDQAAAALLVLEAGGAVGTLSGAAWTPYARDPVMAASSELIALCAAADAQAVASL